MNEKVIIDQIEFSLRNYDLRDIKLISKQDAVIASFILCSCFIEHMCTFRYGMPKNVGLNEFKDFVKEYLSKYDPEKLREDLRNKLVHNYSLGETYVLVMGYPNLHLQEYSPNQKYLNLENFIKDLEDAFNTYLSDLKTNKHNLRQLAVDAYNKVKIIGLNITQLIPDETIIRKIYVIREQKVMLDFDLAVLYEVETKRLNEQVKRNIDRFPGDFMFRLSSKEWQAMRSQFATSSTQNADIQIDKNMRSQIVTSSQKKRNTAITPYAFTEHGVTMLASVLNSERAVKMSIAIVRAFIELKNLFFNTISWQLKFKHYKCI